MLEKDSGGRTRIAKEVIQPFLSRQDAPQVFDMNAAVHVWNRDSLIKDPKILYPSTLIYEMPQERSHDIDTEVDFRIVFATMYRINRMGAKSEEMKKAKK